MTRAVATVCTLLLSLLAFIPAASADKWCDDPAQDQRGPSEKLPKQGVIQVDRYSFGNRYSALIVNDDGTLGYISLNGHDSQTPLVSAWETPAECFGSAGSLRTGGWGVTPWGQVFTDSSAEAGHYGDMNGQRLNQPIVGMAPTPTGLGYWLVASDGGMFTFGDARFLGSTGAIALNKPIVAMAATPTGNGYWLAASDGGLFTFGDAKFLGSMGATPLNQPVVGMVPTTSGRGYWMVAADGGIFTFGDAAFRGSTGGQTLASPVAGMIPYSDGYAIVTENGTVYPFATYYSNCDEAERAGAAPMERGEPGYREGLDRDGDGIACD